MTSHDVQTETLEILPEDTYTGSNTLISKGAPVRTSQGLLYIPRSVGSSNPFTGSSTPLFVSYDRVVLSSALVYNTAGVTIPKTSYDLTEAPNLSVHGTNDALILVSGASYLMNVTLHTENSGSYPRYERFELWNSFDTTLMLRCYFSVKDIGLPRIYYNSLCMGIKLPTDGQLLMTMLTVAGSSTLQADSTSWEFYRLA